MRPQTDHTILIVDDEEAIRSSLSDVLADEGYAVATAADGVEAIDYLRHTPRAPCLILLDLWMPRLNGPGSSASWPRWVSSSTCSSSVWSSIRACCASAVMPPSPSRTRRSSRPF